MSDEYIFSRNITQLKDIAREMGMRGYSMFTSADRELLAELISQEIGKARRRGMNVDLPSLRVPSSEIDDIAMELGKTLMVKGGKLSDNEEATLMHLIEKKISLSDDESDEELTLMAKMLEEKLMEDEKPKRQHKKLSKAMAGMSLGAKPQTFKRRKRKLPVEMERPAKKYHDVDRTMATMVFPGSEYY